MSEPFLGEIKLISFNFAPKGWAFCNGQLLPINQNQALFAILGTTYGGDGMRTFGLPNFQGRVPMHAGNGFVLGELGGEQAHTLNISELPAHTHVPQAVAGPGNQQAPGDHVWASDSLTSYSTNAPDTTMNQTLAPVGGSQPHNNMPPYLVLTFIIALQGIFPSQN